MRCLELITPDCIASEAYDARHRKGVNAISRLICMSKYMYPISHLQIMGAHACRERMYFYRLLRTEQQM